jgi:ribose 5-phosphate isomerase B
VAANKFKGIRAATCHEVFSAHQSVEDDDCNVMCIGARVVAAELASDLIRTYMGARFSGLERHRRRLEKIRGFEQTIS